MRIYQYYNGVVVKSEEALILAEEKREMNAATERVAEKNHIQAELKDARDAKKRREEHESTRNYMNARRSHQARISVTASTQGLRAMR